jgi:Prohead core protein serine protease
MSKQLLIEYSVFKPISILKEAAGNSSILRVAGLLSSADVPNANKRLYPYPILKEQVDRYISGPIKERRSYGELDHPETSIINFHNVSHWITKVWWEGKNLYGELEILPTPAGDIAKALFERKLSVGISSRAMGSVTPIGEGLVQVEDDLDLIGYDLVSTPSNFGSYMSPINTSGLKESIQHNIHTDKYTRAHQLIRDIICSQSGNCCIN